MGVLKRKQENEAITFKLPAALKREIETLRIGAEDAGFSDQVNNHYLATFGTAAVTSLISAGQMVGQMSAFGGGGVYGPYGYYQPNQWAMAGETAGSAASGKPSSTPMPDSSCPSES